MDSPAPLPISSRFSSSPCDQLPHAPIAMPSSHDRPCPFLAGRQHSPYSLNSVSRIWLHQWMRKLTYTLLWTLSIHFLLSSIIIFHLYPCCQCPAWNLLAAGSPGLSLRLLTVLLCGLFLAFKTQAQMPSAALGEALEDPAGKWLTLPVSNSSADTSSHSPMSVLSLWRTWATYSQSLNEYADYTSTPGLLRWKSIENAWGRAWYEVSITEAVAVSSLLLISFINFLKIFLILWVAKEESQY